MAGPVTAAAVVLPEDFPRSILKDSKALSLQARIKAEILLRRAAVCFSIGWAWPGEIDVLNIHNASLLAMKRALFSLPPVFSEVQVDGKYTFPCEYPISAVIKGDSKVSEIMAASILAKNARDRWMEHYANIDTRYGFEKHKGYPTKEHRKSVLLYGPSVIHRKSYRISSPE